MLEPAARDSEGSGAFFCSWRFVWMTASSSMSQISSVLISWLAAGLQTKGELSCSSANNKVSKSVRILIDYKITIFFRVRKPFPYICVK